jgi:hypothetical protein
MLECDSKWRLKQRTRRGSAGLWEQLPLFSQLILFCGPILRGVYYRQVNNAQLPPLLTYLSRTYFCYMDQLLLGINPFEKKKQAWEWNITKLQVFVLRMQ